MSLVEHMYELRNRLTIALVAIVITTVFGYIWFAVPFFGLPSLGEILKGPYCSLPASSRAVFTADGSCTLLGTGPFDQFTLRLKVGATAGVVLACPIWLYQIWAFIVPGLHPRERKWTRVFAAIAGPLFLLGVTVGYYVLPKGLSILLDFTPADVSNLIEVSRYLSFILRMLLVFGVAFEIPLFVVLLNLAGIVTGRALGRARAWIVLGTFVFAAVATPSTDPISMLFLAVPMTLLFLISEGIARLIDRRRGIHDYEAWSDDEQSELVLDRDTDDERPSSLDESDD